MLAARGRIKTGLRAWFEAQGFTEVEAGQLVASPGAEAHLHAFATQAIGPDGAARTLYLHTSPEFAAKKLLAAGETAIFDFARVFRNRERGPLHAPEFTMLEWYRAHAQWETVMDDACLLLRIAAQAAGARALGWRDRICDPFIPAERLTVADAFARHAGMDLTATLDAAGNGDRDALAAQVSASGLRVAKDDSWSDLFSRVLVARIEPHLGLHAPVLLHSYPACEAALARRNPADPRFAERFELYACGVELPTASAS
jgi:lysyl-tRNA synthetase class 2